MNNAYQLNVAPYGTHKLIANEVGNNLSILDVGCNKGYFKFLIDESNKISGVDWDSDDLAIAKSNGYFCVEKVDLNNCSELKLQEKFDVIIFADVLEHLLNPAAALRFFIDNYLADGGKVIISLPNIAHLTIRIQLLFGKFAYTDSGILDKTHLHFYTLDSARELIGASGLEIVGEKFSSNRFGRLLERVDILKTLLAFNLIFICRKSESS